MDLIDEIILREGGFVNDPDDSGGRTIYGISERAHPELWKDGPPSYETARKVYEQAYILAEKFDQIPDPWLRDQVIDYGVTSGPDTATRLLQEVLGVKVDGVIGPQTLKAINNFPPSSLFGYPVPGRVALNLAFERARAVRYIRLVQKRPKDVKFLFGWLKRAVGFRGSK